MTPLYLNSVHDSPILNSHNWMFTKSIYKVQTRAHYVDSISCRPDSLKSVILTVAFYEYKEDAF